MKLSALMNVRPSKTWIVLGAALVIGGLAAIAARNYLASEMAAIEARARGKTVAVIVAKKELTKGEKISPANVAIREIPSDYAHSAAVTPDAFERLDGQTLAYAVQGGEMILWGLLENQRAPTFSAKVGSGRRAMTVPVDEISSISGMLEPGDAIDLVLRLDHKGRKVTFPLLQSVQVLATGQRSIDDPRTGEKRQYSTVTLDTTPAQAQNVIVAREVGKLTALLRNPKDKARIDNASYDIAALLGAKSADGIPVLYGGSLSKQPADALRLARPSAAPAAALPIAPFAPTPTVISNRPEYSIPGNKK